MLGIAAGAIVVLLLLSLLTAFATGIPAGSVVSVLTDGFGSTLAAVALLVGLGAMLGRIVEMSGGAKVLADFLIRLFGEKRAPSPSVSPHCSSASRSSSTRAWSSCCRWSSPSAAVSEAACCSTGCPLPAPSRSCTSSFPRTLARWLLPSSLTPMSASYC